MAKDMDIPELIARLRQMDSQFLGGRGHTGRTFFQQCADAMEMMHDLCHPHKAVKGSQAVVLYFERDEDREEFIRMCKIANPKLKAKKL